ncbi:MAG: class I SAM-dependent methyltransferase [Acidobacteriota bacterium]
MDEDSWQLQLFRRSIKKKDKLRILSEEIKIDENDIVLDLGCAQGLLSYFLKQKGGCWIHADLDFPNLKSSVPLLKRGLIQTGPRKLPFKTGCFDKIISLDFLEHVDDDLHCLQEIKYLLKPKGELFLTVPHTGRFFLLHRLRPLFGIKPEDYGHIREGYSLKTLKQMLEEAGFRVEKHRHFSRLFSEFIELLINAVYIKFLGQKESPGLRDGHIRPMSDQEFREKGKAFQLYSLLYPFIWLISRLDKILIFHKGYSLYLKARKKDSSSHPPKEWKNEKK